MKVRARTAALILPLFFLLGIGSSIVSGYWRTESSKQPFRYTEGEMAGEYNPADIRGSYSLADLEAVFTISVETLAKAFGAGDHKDPSSLKIKEFEEAFGMIDGMEVGTDSMRLFIALYLNRPYIPEEGTALPQPAYNILKNEGNSSPDQLTLYEDRVISLDSVQLSEGEEDNDYDKDIELLEIKGKTTFTELLDCGITEDQIVDALGGLPMGVRVMSVRDYCRDQGVEFSEVKAKLQDILDQDP